MSEAALPEGWSIKRLAELARVTSGKRLPKGRRLSIAQTDHPYIRVTDMFMGGVNSSDIQYVPDDVFPEISRFTVDAGDIFISCAGTLGLVGMVPETLDGANLTENANRIWSIECDSRFLLSVLLSDRIQSVIQNIQTVGAQPKLALGRIRDFEIPCPESPAEQQAIAAALSDADGVVAGLERVIAKKRLIKQGAMQDLLTARRRLPGFSGEWEVKRLGELGQFFKGSGVRKDDARSGVLPCVRYGELYTVHHDVVRHFTSHISDEVAQTARQIRQGDILFAGSGETKEEIGKCAAVVHEGPVYAGGDIVGFRPTTSDGIFLSYLLNAPAAQKQKASRGQGDAVVHINASALSEIQISLPCAEEQRAISGVLEDMDAEIQALESRLTKARAVKEGMMQNLLTGRVRLV